MKPLHLVACACSRPALMMGALGLLVVSLFGCSPPPHQKTETTVTLRGERQSDSGEMVAAVMECACSGLLWNLEDPSRPTFYGSVHAVLPPDRQVTHDATGALSSDYQMLTNYYCGTGYYVSGFPSQRTGGTSIRLKSLPRVNAENSERLRFSYTGDAAGVVVEGLEEGQEVWTAQGLIEVTVELR